MNIMFIVSIENIFIEFYLLLEEEEWMSKFIISFSEELFVCYKALKTFCSSSNGRKPFVCVLHNNMLIILHST